MKKCKHDFPAAHCSPMTDKLAEARKGKCHCDATVKIQQYQGQLCIIVPNFIKLLGMDGKPRKKLAIDVCLVAEIFWLWKKGIRTTGCCCGHNQMEAYIGVLPEDIPKMKKLGYRVAPNPSRPDDEDSFYPTAIAKIKAHNSKQ